MDHKTRMSLANDPNAVAFSTSSSGVGDVTATALVLLADPGRMRVHAGLGVGVPTGSIEATDVTPMSNGAQAQLPYPMQRGSGTVDALPSLTVLGQTDRFGWGIQARGTVRLGTNDRDYSLGDRAGLTTWGSVLLGDVASASVRLDGQAWGNIDGADPAYAMAVTNRLVPTVFPDLRAGERVDLSLGLNAKVPTGVLEGFRVAAEVGVPLYQRLAGPQLETDFVLTLGAQYAFDW
jgi:hypothetical protein